MHTDGYLGHGISNHIHNSVTELITHPCPNFNDALTDRPYDMDK